MENGGSAAGSVTGTRTESAGGPDLVSADDVPVPASERGRERDPLEMMELEVADVESERGIVGWQWGETAGVERGVENEREGAGARIARGTGKEARGLMEKRSVRETESLRVVRGCWRNMKEKLVRAWRSGETGTEKGTGNADAVTETETGVGETGTETGSTRGKGGRERGETAERSATAPYEMTWAPKMTWAMRMREEHRHTQRSTVRMG